MPVKTGKNRDEFGKFVKGISGNPKGKPKGSGLKLTPILKEELEKVPEGAKEAHKVLFVRKLIDNAVLFGDIKAMKIIMNYVDGLPRSTVDIQINGDEITDEEINEAILELVNNAKTRNKK